MVVVGPTASGVILIAHIDVVSPASAAMAAGVANAQRQQHTQAIFQDVVQSAIVWAKAKVKPTSNLKLARSAINVSDTDASASSSAPAKGSGLAQ